MICLGLLGTETYYAFLSFGQAVIFIFHLLLLGESQ
jgi:hypothetical protein